MNGPKNIDLDMVMAANAVQDALPSASVAVSTTSCTLVFDCRDVPQPTSADATFHTGLHPQFFSDFSKTAKVAKLIREVQTGLGACQQRGKTHLNFVFVDVTGRFGALACAKAIAECLLAEPLLSLTRITVIRSEPDWSCNECSRCLFWDRKWNNKNIAVNSIVQKWKNVKQGLEVT